MRGSLRVGMASYSTATSHACRAGAFSLGSASSITRPRLEVSVSQHAGSVSQHAGIEQVYGRAARARDDSDVSYFFDLLLLGECLTKTIVLGMVAAIAEDKDRNRYRLEYTLVRSDGIGDWGRVLDDVLTGPASQFLVPDAREEQTQLTRGSQAGDWQYDATLAMKSALDGLGIESEQLNQKSDMRRWFRQFTLLRNKTRGHGAPPPTKLGQASILIAESIDLVFRNFNLFKRSWAHLHRNLSGKYRVTPVGHDCIEFNHLKQAQDAQWQDGLYIYVGGLRRIPLVRTDPELHDFFIANGGFNDRRYELLSYVTGNKFEGDASIYLTPLGTLPPSETDGPGELLPRGNCFTNMPEPLVDYVSRPELEASLLQLLLEDRRPIVTLIGRGGIGKTSLALQVIERLIVADRYYSVVWLSARDVDLKLTGPKPVRPSVQSAEDMARLYAEMVLSPGRVREKGFDSKAFFAAQLQKCDLGPCLFVFDNFETTQNPIDTYNWVDTFIRVPNKVLITTRLREFKGDYPLEVGGMTEPEARQLIEKTASSLGVSALLKPEYVREVIEKSEGHPYVIKILLGEVAKERRAVNVPRLLARSDDILTALFERTYASLSPCAQRAFLTLSAWNSGVPRLALQAVLFRSTEERQEVERGIESLVQYSMAEIHIAPSDHQEFIALPLVASVFGKKKLNISPFKAGILADVELLQMLGPSRRDDVHLGLARTLETFIGGMAKRIDAGASYDEYGPVLEAICDVYNTGWLLLARWHMEERSPEGFARAKEELRRFLENGPGPDEAADAWWLLAQTCYETNDYLGEIHALTERAQGARISFYDVSSAANLLNGLLSRHGADFGLEEKRSLVSTILGVMIRRKDEAGPDDLSRMAWLAIHHDQEARAREFVQSGLATEPENSHLQKLAQRLGLVLADAG